MASTDSIPDPGALELPDAIRPHLVPDALFGAAYEAVPAPLRARAKSCIAALHAAWGGVPTAEERRRLFPAHGLGVMDSGFAPDWALVVAGPGMADPACVLAACAPLRQAGVGTLAVALTVPSVVGEEGDRMPAPEGKRGAVLAALELAGEEAVAACTGEEAAQWASQWAQTGAAGLVLALESGAAVPEAMEFVLPESLSRRVPVRILSAPSRIGLWCDAESCWDAAAVTWAHPGALCVAMGPGAASCAESVTTADIPVRAEAGGFEEFLRAGFDVCLAPEDRLGACMAAAPLALGPGMEGVFAWPGLTPESLRDRRMAFARFS